MHYVAYFISKEASGSGVLAREYKQTVLRYDEKQKLKMVQY
jgi:hypothetical protein